MKDPKHLALLLLLLAGCKSLPVELQAIKDKVDSRMTYRYYRGKDYRWLPNGGEGNCATYAFNYAVEARKAGFDAEVRLCRRMGGEGHAVALVDGQWILQVGRGPCYW